MGNTFSRTRGASDEQSVAVVGNAQNGLHGSDSSLQQKTHDAQIAGSIAGPSSDNISAIPRAEDGPAVPAGLAPDLQFIIEAGLHQEVEGVASNTAAGDAGQQGSIQDAVKDLKAKYNIGQPVIDGELERIRREIALKTKLIQMKEMQRQQRIAQQVQKSQSQQNGVAGASAGDGNWPAFKVDVKGKGRASSPEAPPKVNGPKTESVDDSSSDDDEDGDEDGDGDGDSSDSDHSSSSSSSSGSSIAAPKPKQNGVRVNHRAASDDEEFDGSDDEDAPAKKLEPEEIAMAAAAFASQHEIVNPQVPPPPVERLPEHVPLRSIGQIDHIIGTVIVVRADLSTQESAHGQILDEGSLLCLGDRRVLGAIFETFGSIHSPFYSIRLPPGHPLVDKEQVTDEAKASGCAASGMQVFYSPSPDFSGLLYTRDIREKQGKASDASNLYDEEVGGNEIEFSDDEEEAEYRRGLKERKKERWAERQNLDASQREAEFVFDDDFDEAASMRSFANRSTGTADEEHEEGSIVEDKEIRKRRLSNSMETSRPPAPHKQARQERGGHSSRGRGSGDRGRGGKRGRGAHDNQDSSRGGRGGRGRGGPQDSHASSRRAQRGRGLEGRSGQTRMPYERNYPAPGSHGLPPRPAYQHPDALPYDDAPLPYASQGSVSPSRQQPHVALPMRPTMQVEQYDPVNARSPTHVQSDKVWSSSQPMQPFASAQQTFAMPTASFPSFSAHQEYHPSVPHNMYQPMPSAYQPQQHQQPVYNGLTNVAYTHGYSGISSQTYPPHVPAPYGDDRKFDPRQQ